MLKMMGCVRLRDRRKPPRTPGVMTFMIRVPTLLAATLTLLVLTVTVPAIATPPIAAVPVSDAR